MAPHFIIIADLAALEHQGTYLPDSFDLLVLPFTLVAVFVVAFVDFVVAHFLPSSLSDIASVPGT